MTKMWIRIRNAKVLTLSSRTWISSSLQSSVAMSGNFDTAALGRPLQKLNTKNSQILSQKLVNFEATTFQCQYLICSTVSIYIIKYQAYVPVNVVVAPIFCNYLRQLLFLTFRPGSLCRPGTFFFTYFRKFSQ